MKKRWLIIGAALASFGVAQPALAGPFADAIGATARNVMVKAGFDPDSPAGQATLSAIGVAMDAANIAGGGPVGTTAGLGLMYMLNNLLPQGWRIGGGTGGGSFGGGGATGEWTDQCDFDFRLDPDGNLIVPALPMKGSGGMEKGDLVTFTGAYVRSPSNSILSPNLDFYSGGKTPEGMSLRAQHLRNIAYGTDKRYWLGAFEITGSGASTFYHFSRPASYVGATKIPSKYEIQNVIQLAVSTTGTSKSCPANMTGAGGDFDFYYEPFDVTTLTKTGTQQAWVNCVWYAHTSNLSANGYAYPEVAIWPASMLKDFPDNSPLKNCKVAADLVAKATQELWDRAAGKSGYTGYPAQPVNPSDARSDGPWPTVDSLGDPPTQHPPLTPPVAPSASPTPDPTPTPTPSSSAPAYDPTVTLADPASPDISWWPTLPTIAVDLGSPDCPTWPLDLTSFGGPSWNYVISAQCPIIENNRDVIGTVMLLLFGVTAVLIVLKA